MYPLIPTTNLHCVASLGLARLCRLMPSTLGACVLGVMFTYSTASLAQTVTPVTPVTPTLSATSTATAAPRVSSEWARLTAAQKEALTPLAKQWETLSDGQKRKWQVIAETYPKLSPAEQTKLHSRMADWAALSPKDRELARLNFANAKSVPSTDRVSHWEAYQALSEEEKKKLAANSSVKPAGASVAVKPIPANKLTTVPNKPLPASPASTPAPAPTTAPAN